LTGNPKPQLPQERQKAHAHKNVKISWQTTTTKFPTSEDCPPIVALVMTPSVPLLCFPSLVPGLQNTTTFFVSPTQAHFFFFFFFFLFFFLFMAFCFY
jgi:hypothetical protein